MMLAFSKVLSVVFLIARIRFFVHAGAASNVDISAGYPEGWCDKRYGMPTRTTGECICKQACDGPNCKHEQGLAFYSYASCPSCKCILKSSPRTDSASDKNNESADDVVTSPDDGGVVHKRHNDHAGASRMYDDANEEGADMGSSKPTTTDNNNKEEDDEELSILELLGANGKLIFAIAVSFGLVLFIVVPVVFLSLSAKSQQQKADASTPEVSPRREIYNNKENNNDGGNTTTKRTPPKPSSPRAGRSTAAADNTVVTKSGDQGQGSTVRRTRTTSTRLSGARDQEQEPEQKQQLEQEQEQARNIDPIAAAREAAKLRQQKAVEAKVASLKKKTK